MGCKQLTYQKNNFLQVVHRKNGQAQKKNALDYFSGGMPMPNRQIVGGEPYRYAYQGQEKDPETGKEAFQLRLWDSRIGRWLTTDPAGQFASPYLGMGNNPISAIDPDGGTCVDTDRNPITCPEGYGAFNGPTVDTGVFDNGKFVGYDVGEISITLSRGVKPPLEIQNSLNTSVNNKLFSEKMSPLITTMEGASFLLRNESITIVEGLGPNGNLFDKSLNVGKTLGNAVNYANYISIASDIYTGSTTDSETTKEKAFQSATKGTGLLLIGKYNPVTGVIVTGYDLLFSTEKYQKIIHDTRARVIRENTPVFLRPIPRNLEFKPRN